MRPLFRFPDLCFRRHSHRSWHRATTARLQHIPSISMSVSRLAGLHVVITVTVRGEPGPTRTGETTFTTTPPPRSDRDASSLRTQAGSGGPTDFCIERPGLVMGTNVRVRWENFRNPEEAGALEPRPLRSVLIGWGECSPGLTSLSTAAVPPRTRGPRSHRGPIARAARLRRWCSSR